MKNWKVTVMLVGMFVFGACVAQAPVDPPTSDTQADDPAPDIELGKSPSFRPQPGTWYYTCSADLLACAPGYGAVESLLVPDCAPVYRLKCVFGAENP